MPSNSPTLFDGRTLEHLVGGTSEPEMEALLAALRSAEAEAATLCVDFSPLDRSGASHRRLNTTWILACANLLLGRYSTVPIRVVLPKHRSVHLQLLRHTLYFAIAQRQSKYAVSDSDAEKDQVLTRCSGTWSPRRGPVLFEEAPGTRLAQRSYLYANTHARAEPGYFRRYQGSAAFPWLGEVVPRPTNCAGSEVRESFLTETSTSMIEVLDNVSTHAFNLLDNEFRAEWLEPGIGRQARSCLMVSMTKGGRDSHDRLHVVVADNGLGIGRTMRWKHSAAVQNTDDVKIIECVLRQRLTYRDIDGHNGVGLWCLQDLARIAGGTITVTSEDELSGGTAAAQVEMTIAATGSNHQRPVIDARRIDVPWRGTTVHVQLRVPKLENMKSDQLDALRDRIYGRRAAQPQIV